MKNQIVLLLAGVLSVQGCASAADTQADELGTYVRAEPSVLILSPGQSSLATTRAFNLSTNDPADVAWSIGHVGAGLTVAEDTAFGLLYQGERLAQPARSNIRRYVVTLTGPDSSSFVISGDASVATIVVRPAVPAP
ncbi:MAG: hypothetical protein ABI679_00410 [Gemmatimonadota bacterium]